MAEAQAGRAIVHVDLDAFCKPCLPCRFVRTRQGLAANLQKCLPACMSTLSHKVLLGLADAQVEQQRDPDRLLGKPTAVMQVHLYSPAICPLGCLSTEHSTKCWLVCKLLTACKLYLQYNPFGDLKTYQPEDDRIMNNSNGSLIAVSYEARARGVKR